MHLDQLRALASMSTSQWLIPCSLRNAPVCLYVHDCWIWHKQAAANAGTAGAPAFIRTVDDTGQTWQYMMPDNVVDSDACPSGHGSGVYKPKGVQSVVAIVGSAHVRGIIAELQRMSIQG